MGRHVIGYEVQTVLAAVDWFATQPGDVKIGVCGYGEGGLVAFYAAALDPRIDAALVSGYFDSRQQVWAEPIYRNVWGRLREFGDAEIAGLILPRALVIEHSAGARGHRTQGRTAHAGVCERERGSRANRNGRRSSRRRHSCMARLGARSGRIPSAAVAAFATRAGHEGTRADCRRNCLPTGAKTSIPACGIGALFAEMEGHVQSARATLGPRPRRGLPLTR